MTGPPGNHIVPESPSRALSRAKTWLETERCRAALVDVASVLASDGVRLLAFKGIHVAYAFADPWFRRMGDADAIVIEGSFERAIHVARARGWAVLRTDWSEAAVQPDPHGPWVDLHRRATPPGFGRVRNEALRARALAAPAALGPHVLVPDAYDAAALCLANHAKDRLGKFGHGKAALDLAAIVDAAGVDPSRLAERVAEHGLRRIALVSLAGLAREDARWERFLSACTRDPVEISRARRTAEAILRHARTRAVGFVLVRALADDPVDAVVGLGVAAVRRLPYLLREKLELPLRR